MAAIIADDLERTRRFFTSKVNLISGQKAFEGLVDVCAPNRVPGRHLVFFWFLMLNAKLHLTITLVTREPFKF